MTPNDIEVLLHTFCSPERHPRAHAPAVQKALSKLLQAGLIERRFSQVKFQAVWGNEYRTTPRGDAHVKQLCALPFPQAAWRDAAGKIIE